MIHAERAARVQAEATTKAEAANARADLSSRDALIAHLKLEIEKLRRALYGSRSERKARLLEQMDLSSVPIAVLSNPLCVIFPPCFDHGQLHLSALPSR